MKETSKPNPHQNYIDAVKDSASTDPMPTVQNLAKNTGLEPEEIVHYPVSSQLTMPFTFSMSPVSAASLSWRRASGVVDMSASEPLAAHWTRM